MVYIEIAKVQKEVSDEAWPIFSYLTLGILIPPSNGITAGASCTLNSAREQTTEI